MISNVSAPAKWGVVAAAVAVAVIIGAAFLSGNRDQGLIAAPPAPVPTPLVTPAASATPSPSLSRLVSLSTAPRSSCGPVNPTMQCLTPGTYIVDGKVSPDGTTTSLTVPDGWFQWGPGLGANGVLVESDTKVGNSSGWGITVMLPDDVAVDPCDLRLGTVDGSTSSVDAFLGAISSWPSFRVTKPRSTSVAGRAGKAVTVSYRGDEAACLANQLWKTRDVTSIDTYPMVDAPGVRQPATFNVVPVGGRVVVIRTTDFPDTSPYERSQGVAADPMRHAQDQVAQQAILDSIRITDGGP